MKTNNISVTPVKKYAPPKYPTLTAATHTPELLRKLPTRWQKNAAVVAAVGMLGAMTTLNSCGIQNSSSALSVTQEITVEDTTASDIVCTTSDTDNFPLMAGTAAPPSVTSEQESAYPALAGDVLVEITSEQDVTTALPETDTQETAVAAVSESTDILICTPGVPAAPAFLSEEEALAIIKNMAESAGLKFDDTTSDDFDLYDAQKGVAISYNTIYETGSTEEIGETYINYEGTNIAVGNFDLGYNDDFYDVQQLEEQLRAQVRDFIEWLQGQGII